MSSVRTVPETELMSGEELSADDAWHTVRRYGLRHLLATAFVRFRYGDGFSHARAFGLQVVVALGLATAFAAATSAFAQLERGANRIYGTKRDRPALRKYGSAAMLTATAGVAMAVGLLLIVAGEPFGDALEQVYRWGDAAETVWDVVRWPVGLAALVVAVTLLFRHAPRRRQPGLSWLAVGAAVTVLAWLAGSGLLAVYVAAAAGFGDTYGPLTAVMALLLWANITGIALLAGLALAAQLEAVRAGRPDPLLLDSDDDGIPDELDEHPHSPAR